MKTLVESLFDTENNIEKDLTFGDIYKPVDIKFSRSLDAEAIGNMFVMSKLKNIKPLSLDGIRSYDNFKRWFPYLPYVLAKVAELPLDEKFMNTRIDANNINYEFKLEKMFREYQRAHNTNVYAKRSDSFSKLSFTMMTFDYKPSLQIRKTTNKGILSITIEYDRK
jgi:hypothetical protein